MSQQTQWRAAGPGTIWPDSGKSCHVARIVTKQSGGQYLDYVMDAPYRKDKVKAFTLSEAEKKANQLNNSRY